MNKTKHSSLLCFFYWKIYLRLPAFTRRKCLRSFESEFLQRLRNRNDSSNDNRQLKQIFFGNASVFVTCEEEFNQIVSIVCCSTRGQPWHSISNEHKTNILKQTSNPAQAIIRTVNDASDVSKISTISLSGPSTKHNRHILSGLIEPIILIFPHTHTHVIWFFTLSLQPIVIFFFYFRHFLFVSKSK